MRTVTLEGPGDFRGTAEVLEVLNGMLKSALPFQEIPPVNKENEIYVYKSGRKMPYKVCPETICEEIGLVADPNVSLVEKLQKDNEPMLVDRVKKCKEPLGIPLPDDGGGFFNGTSEAEPGRRAGSLSRRAW